MSSEATNTQSGISTTIVSSHPATTNDTGSSSAANRSAMSAPEKNRIIIADSKRPLTPEATPQVVIKTDAIEDCVLADRVLELSAVPSNPSIEGSGLMAVIEKDDGCELVPTVREGVKDLETQASSAAMAVVIGGSVVDEDLPTIKSEIKVPAELSLVVKRTVGEVSEGVSEAAKILEEALPNRLTHEPKVQLSERVQVRNTFTTQKTEITPTNERSKPGPKTYGKEKGLVPPLDAVWSSSTLRAKSNQKNLWKWLELTGRDPRLPQYQGLVEQLYEEVHAHMVEDNGKSKAMQQTRDPKSEQEKTVLDAEVTADGGSSETDANQVYGKRKRVKHNAGADPEGSLKKQKVADIRPVSGNSRQVKQNVETESTDDPNGETQEATLTKGRVAAVRSGLEGVKKAAFDSLQLQKLNIQAENHRGISFPDQYSQYARWNPQLILQGDDGKPLFDYDTQLAVFKVLQRRENLLSWMKEEHNALKGGMLFNKTLKAFKKDCRFIRARVGKEIKEDRIERKRAAKNMVNELFTHGIAGGGI